MFEIVTCVELPGDNWPCDGSKLSPRLPDADQFALPCESEVSESVTWHWYVWPSFVLHSDCVGSNCVGVTDNVGGPAVGDGDGLGVGEHDQLTVTGCSPSWPENVNVSLWHGMFEMVTDTD